MWDMGLLYSDHWGTVLDLCTFEASPPDINHDPEPICLGCDVDYFEYCNCINRPDIEYYHVNVYKLYLLTYNL